MNNPENNLPQLNLQQTPLPVNPKQQLSAERILFDTLREYGHHFWQYLAVAAVVLVPMSGFTAWFNPETRPWYLFLPFAVIAKLITCYPQIAMLYLARENIAHDPSKIKDAYLTSATLFIPFAWTIILITAATFGGLICCIIPGIIAFFIFGIADGIVVWEGRNGIPALKRSVELIKPHFFKVVWVLIFYELVIGGISVLLELIPTFFNPALSHWLKDLLKFELETNPTPQPWWYILYSQLIRVVFFPTNAIMTFFLYRRLKEISEQRLELPLNL